MSDRDTGGLNSPLAQELLERARALGPTLKERSAQCEAMSKVPDETIADFQDAGFFKILQSEKYGGYELDPQVYYGVVLEVAKHCMSSAWVLSVIGVHNWQLNLFDPQAAAEVWKDDPSVLISSSYAPVGLVKPVDGGFMLTGRWSFSSGCEHCKWVFLGAVVPVEGQPWDIKNYRTFLVPLDDYKIEKNWDVVGLKGTGSHDIELSDVFVPEHRTHFMLGDTTSDKHSDKRALYRLPFMQVFSRAVCTATLGALESALEDYIQVAQFRIAGGQMMRDHGDSKKVAAQVKANIESMKLVMMNSFDEMLKSAETGIEIDMVERARYRYESSMVADRCIELSSKMLKAAGSGGIRNNSPLLKKHLNMLASQAHVANVSESFELNLGGILFGHEPTELGL